MEPRLHRPPASFYRPRIRTPARSGPRSRAATAPTPRPRSPPRSARSPPAPWPALTPSERGRLLWRLGDLVVANAPRLAEIEQRDNGKLAVEVVAQVRYMGDYFHYYAGLADKVQSAVIPTDKKGVFAYTRYEPKGVVAIITPWNSPLTLHELEARAGARRRLHRGHQAVGVHLGVDARAGQAVRRGGVPERRRQRRHRPRPRGRRGAGDASGGRARSASPAAPRRAARSTSSRRATSRP